MFLLNDNYLRIITDCLRQCPHNFFKFMSTCKLQRLQLCVHTRRYSPFTKLHPGDFLWVNLFAFTRFNGLASTSPALARYLNVSDYSGNYYKCFITHFGCEIIFWPLVAFWCRSGSFISFVISKFVFNLFTRGLARRVSCFRRQLYSQRALIWSLREAISASSWFCFLLMVALSSNIFAFFFRSAWFSFCNLEIK